MVEQWNIWLWNSAIFDNGTVEQWNSGTCDCGLVHLMWWNCRTFVGGRVKDLMMEE